MMSSRMPGLGRSNPTSTSRLLHMMVPRVLVYMVVSQGNALNRAIWMDPGPLELTGSRD